MGVTPNQKRDARVMAATMDHSSIRALGSAFPHFFAGLPRSDSGDHRGGCSLKTFEGSPHRSHASRFWLGVTIDGQSVHCSPPSLRYARSVGKSCSRMDWNVTCNVPNEAGKFAGNGDADFVGFHLPTQAELAVPLGEAQLRLPRNIPDRFGLALLANLLL